MKTLAIATLTALSLTAFAAEPAIQTSIPASGAGVGAQLMQLLFGLLLVIGLIFLLAWLVRRMQQVVPRGGQVIQLLASQSLGARERLLLVEVGGEQILLGLTPGSIRTLHVLAKPVSAEAAQPATPEFAQRLMELLGKNQKDRS